MIYMKIVCQALKPERLFVCVADYVHRFRAFFRAEIELCVAVRVEYPVTMMNCKTCVILYFS